MKQVQPTYQLPPREKYKPDPSKSLSCSICGKDTEFDPPFCFECICDIQEGTSENICRSVENHGKIPKQHTVESILNTVSEFTGISTSAICSKNRHTFAIIPRQICHYLSRKKTKNSLAIIGYEVGKCNHATVLNSIKKISNLLETDKAFRGKYGDLIGGYE
jgi:chromosomal replication initiation ATPase DnaA